jgi:hypothetical protein
MLTRNFVGRWISLGRWAVQSTVTLSSLSLELLHFELCLWHNSETTRGILFCVQNLFEEHQPVLVFYAVCLLISPIWCQSSAVAISKPQQKWTNQWACSGVRVTNTCTPVNALCMYMYPI